MTTLKQRQAFLCRPTTMSTDKKDAQVTRLRFSSQVNAKAPEILAHCASPHSEHIKRLDELYVHSFAHHPKQDVMVLQCTLRLLPAADTPPDAPSGDTPSGDDDETPADPLLRCAEKMSDVFSKTEKNSEQVVLKVREPAKAFFTEGTKLLEMLRNAALAALLPPVHAFMSFEMDGKRWGGVCTAYCPHCVNHIVFPGKNAEMAALAQRFVDSSPSADGGGVPVRYAPGRSLRTATLAACIELLQRMHALGWVHGDTHMGNFMLDPSTWRVYAIDVERAFRSDCPRQHMTDLQELIGHATGLLLSTTPSAWDMRDILGVLIQLHPDLRSSGKKHSKRRKLSAADDVLRLLPVCLCFVCDVPKDRIRGCPKCNTPFFNENVARYTKNARACIDSLLHTSLEELSRSILEPRAAAHKSLRSVADPLLRLLRRKDAKRLRDDTPFAADDAMQSPNFRDTFDHWVANLLFMGPVLRRPFEETDKLLDGLMAMDSSEALSVAALIQTARVI